MATVLEGQLRLLPVASCQLPVAEAPWWERAGSRSLADYVGAGLLKRGVPCEVFTSLGREPARRVTVSALQLEVPWRVMRAAEVSREACEHVLDLLAAMAMGAR